MATKGTNVIFDCYVSVTDNSSNIWKHSYNKLKYKQNTAYPMTVTKVWNGTVTLSGGTATIDLTSLSGGVDFTGLQIKMVQLKAHADNTEPVKFADPNYCSNQYASARQMKVGPGDTFIRPQFGYSSASVVSSTVKNIICSSDDADAVLYVRLSAGPA